MTENMEPGLVTALMVAAGRWSRNNMENEYNSGLLLPDMAFPIVLINWKPI